MQTCCWRSRFTILCLCCDQKSKYTHFGHKRHSILGLLLISLNCSFYRVELFTAYIFNDFRKEELCAQVWICLIHTGSKVYIRTALLILLDSRQQVTITLTLCSISVPLVAKQPYSNDATTTMLETWYRVLRF